MNLSLAFRQIFPIILISISFTSCAYFNTYYNTKKYYKEALEENRKRTTERPSASERQKFDQTISQASKVLQLHPNSKYVDDALLIIGESFYHIEEYRKAERKFQELLELFPNSGFVEEAKLWLAKTQMQLNHYDVAQTEFIAMSKNAKKEKIRGEAQFWLGEVFWLQEKYTEANRELNKALMQVDDDQLKINTYKRLGECYLKLETFHQAAESFHQAAKLSKNLDLQFELNIQYAKALNAAGESDQAIEILGKLIEANDQHKQIGMAKLELANSYFAMHADEKAIELYNEIVDLHPRTTAAAGAYLALAQYDEKKLQNYEAAEKNYTQVKLQDAKSEYAEIANKSAANIKELTNIRNEITRLQGLLLTPEEKKIQQNKNLQNGEIDDDSAITGQALKRKNSSDKSSETSNLQDEFSNRQKRKLLPEEADALKNKSNLKEELPDRQQELNESTSQANDLKQQEAPLSAMQIDSINVLITQKKIELAELFLFRFEIADSALFYYLEAISGSKSREYRALAFYSIAQIYDKILNVSVVHDSVLKILANNYLQTPQGKAASQKLGIERRASQQAPLAQTFENAQNLLFEQGKPQAAVNKLREILAEKPDQNLKMQTIYTLGWICENKLQDNKQALSYYNQLIIEFPSSEYAKNVKKKINAVEQEKKQQESKADSTNTISSVDSMSVSVEGMKNDLQKNILKSDSLAAIKNTRPDSSLFQSLPDSLKRNKNQNK